MRSALRLVVVPLVAILPALGFAAGSAVVSHVLPAWSGKDLREWCGHGNLENRRVEGDVFAGETVRPDSQLCIDVREPFEPLVTHEVFLRMRIPSGGGQGQLFWRGTDDASMHRDRRLDFDFSTDGNWHEYRLRPYWQGGSKIVQLRLDVPHSLPTHSRVELAEMRVLRCVSPAFHADTKSCSGVVFSLATPKAEFVTLEWAVDAVTGVCKSGFSTPPDNRSHWYWLDFTKLENGRWANRWKGAVVHVGVRQYLKGRDLPVGDLRFVKGVPNLPPDPGFVSVMPEEAIPRAGRPFPLEIVVRNYGTRPVTGLRLFVEGLPDGVRLGKMDEQFPSGAIPACAGFDSVGNDMGAALPNERRFRLTLSDPGIADFFAGIRLEADGGIVRKASVRIRTLPSLRMDRVAYPPEPRPVLTKPYEIGAFLFPGWDTHRWHGVWSRASERKPLLGWYDERNPEVLDWQIKHLVENGISFAYVDWYWNAGHQWHNHWMDAFSRARYRKYLKWAVMWANHNGAGSHSLADQEKVTRLWIDRFFCQKEYLTVRGLPVVSIWSPFGMERDMRGRGGCKALLELSRRLAREAGYKGVWFVAVRTPDGRTDREWLHQYEDMGFDATCVYKYYGQGAAGSPDVNGVRPFRWIAETSGGHWRAVRANSRLPFLPSLSTGYDPRPWRVEYRDIVEGYGVSEFRRICRDAKAFSDETGVRTLMVGPMDEWGEGSIGYPNAQFGFGILEAVRDTFGERPRGGWPCNYAPEDVGLGPYPTPDAAL